MLSEAAMHTMSDTNVNQAGDVVHHQLLGHGDWIITEAALSGAGKSYCHTYPDAWKLQLRRLGADGSIDWNIPGIIRFQDTTAFPGNIILPYVEPLRCDRLSLGLMTRGDLAAYLRWMADKIETESSVHASLNYDHIAGDEFSVNASVQYRDAHNRKATTFVGQRYVPEKMTLVAEKPAA